MEISGRRIQPGALLRIFLISILVLIDNSGFCLARDPSFRNVSRNVRTRKSIKLEITKDQVVLDNGLLKVTILNPHGHVAEIKFNGIDNVLEPNNKLGHRGYWDVNSNYSMDTLSCNEFRVIKKTKSVVEISFTRSWNVSDELSRDYAPVNVDKRYIMLQGKSGFYSYAILERVKGWPNAGFGEIRAVYRPRADKFKFMAISDKEQRIMPSAEDRAKGQTLGYKEAVRLTNCSDPKIKGEVDDKYQYSQTRKTKVHGWICNDPPVGLWMITPSDEFRNAGPTKVELTSHTGPTMLNMFVSSHYSGKSGMKFRKEEPWKKVFGPFLVYLNSASLGSGPQVMWEDAKRQKDEEVKSWPYNFVKSKDYPLSHQRGGVDGQLLINDRYVNKELIGATSAYVGLASPGEVGSWQVESKGYQFWTEADNEGRFSIKNVRPGVYNLYAWVPRFVGDYKYNITITIRPGETIKLPNLVFSPSRNGLTLWEIGVPDRSAAEFYVPDPNPDLVNRLYLNKPSDKFRQYGLWARYADLYPKNDVVFKVGVSNYTKDWFFAHVTRQLGYRKYKSTTWQIKFELKNVRANNNYTLQLALASAHDSNLHVLINDPNPENTHFSTGMIGKDNAIARHGIHGVYRFYTVNVKSSKLVNGSNTIYLWQARSNTPFEGIMYDYIRLEGPPDL